MDKEMALTKTSPVTRRSFAAAFGTTESKKKKKTAMSKNVEWAIEAQEEVEGENGVNSSKSTKKWWTEGCQIEILDGMIEYKRTKGTDPMADKDDFYAFLMETFTSSEKPNVEDLFDKIKRLKKKYLDKRRYPSEITNVQPHDMKCLQLVKILWPPVYNVKNGSTTVKQKQHVKNGTTTVKEKQHVKNGSTTMKEKQHVKNGSTTVKEKQHVKNGSTTVKEKQQTENVVSPSPVRSRFLFPENGEGSNHNSVGGPLVFFDSKFANQISKDAAALVTASSKNEIEEEMKNVRLKGMELLIMETDFLRKQAVVVIESIKSQQV